MTKMLSRSGSQDLCSKVGGKRRSLTWTKKHESGSVGSCGQLPGDKRVSQP